MRLTTKLLFLSAACLCLYAIAAGCSGSGQNPVTSPPEQVHSTMEKGSESNRVLWGMWEIYFDPIEADIKIVPARTSKIHYNITDKLLPPSCQDCFEITVNSFDADTRILDADVTLRNPYQISGYDVRGILYTNDYGHELRNADDWTGLFDVLGGSDINPFKAFAKYELKRIFAGGAEHTENYLVYIPIPPHYQSIQFAVDASYPSNCKEPYSITNFSQENLYDLPDSSASIFLEVFDWDSSVDTVTIAAGEITGEPVTELNNIWANIWGAEIVNSMAADVGEYDVLITATSSNLALHDFVTLTVDAAIPKVTAIDPPTAEVGSDLNDVTITGDNFKGSDAQVILKHSQGNILASEVVVVSKNEINCRISIPPFAANDFYDVEIINVGNGESGIGIELFQVTLHDINLEDVTPPVLDFRPFNVSIEDNYAYVFSDNSGFVIFDISDPENPVWVNEVKLKAIGKHVEVSGGYAYVSTSDYQSTSLHMIDVDPPESAEIVNVLDFQAVSRGFAVQDDYGYVLSQDMKFHILDLSSPEDASIIKTLDTSSDGNCLEVSGDYAYVGNSPGGLTIIDINPLLQHIS